MSSRQPVIQFSPFEALLIGEKNKILKRQPMKNTIFVTILNQQRKTINLRDLFGIDKDTKKQENKDVIFKMPQRVREFLKTRRLKNMISNGTIKEQDNVLCYEFEGQKMIVKSSESLKSNGKKLILNRVKHKRKFKYKENIKDKIAKKFPVHNHRTYQGRNSRVSQSLVFKDKKHNFEHKHFLRGKDGKFVGKGDHESASRRVSSRKKYLSNYLHQYYLKKNKQIFYHRRQKKNEKIAASNTFTKKKESNMDNKRHAVGSEINLNDLSRNYWKNNCFKDFEFPSFPNSLETSHFEDNCSLIDIIYEKFPMSFKFQCSEYTDDFSHALKNTGIIQPEKPIKMYEKKKNGYSGNSGVMVVFNGHIPYIKLKRLDNIKNNHFPLRKIKNGCNSTIDEPYRKNNQLITAKSIGNLFFRSVDGKDVFIGSLVKPFLSNSWFGSLSEF